jgi:hypothetical protein
MASGQMIQAGLAHARKTVEVTVGSDTYSSPWSPASPSPRPGPAAVTSNGTRHPPARQDERMPDDGTIEEIEGVREPDPGPDATALIRRCLALRESRCPSSPPRTCGS